MNPDSTLASYLRTVCPDADLSGVADALAFAAAMDVVGQVAPEVATAVAAELADQRGHLKLIASENFASPATLLAMGNWLSDKYAEGSPGHRFYAGCENVDTIERRAVELAKGLFGSDHAYVQPHSGIDANLVAFWSILTRRVEAPALERLGAKDLQSLPDTDWESLRHELGNQRLLGMALDAGGHLTHGFRPNVSGKLFEIARYTVDPTTGLLDYDQVRKQAESFRPLVLLAGYSSYPRKINFRVFREIADQVGAVLMVDMAHFAGLVAGKVFSGDFDPVAHAHVVTTTTHKTLRGRGAEWCCAPRSTRPPSTGAARWSWSGPLGHIMAAKAVMLTEAARPEFADYAQRIVDNRGHPGRRPPAAGRDRGHRRHRQPPAPGRRPPLRPHRPPGRDRPPRGRDHPQPQRDPLRPQRLLVHQRPASRHPGRHHPRHGHDEMREVASVVHAVLEATRPVPDSKAKYTLDPAVTRPRPSAAPATSWTVPPVPRIAL